MQNKITLTYVPKNKDIKIENISKGVVSLLMFGKREDAMKMIDRRFSITKSGNFDIEDFAIKKFEVMF